MTTKQIDATVQQAIDAITAARMQLLMDDAPFFGAIASRLVLVPGEKTDTAATDGRSLYFNAPWINALTRPELVALLAHEAMHVALEHTLRRSWRQPYDWNVACDHAVNNELKDCGFKLPADGLCDRDFRGLAAEEIYARVARPTPPPPPLPPVTCGLPGGADDGGGEGTGSGGSADDDAAPPPDDALSDDAAESGDAAGAGSGGAADDDEPKLPPGAVLDSPDPVADKAEIQVAVLEAAMFAAAKGMGKLPGSVARLVNELTRAKLDWREILAEFVQRTCRDDFSFSQPNRRYLSHGVYLPSLRSEGMPEIAFFVDTSGSIDENQLALAVNALDDILLQVQPERVHVICCDTEVRWRATIERGERMKVEAPGGGGTDLRPPFDTLAEEGIEPVCAVYFTDGYGHYPTAAPYPVLWLMTSGHTDVPFGEVVRVANPPGGARS